MPPRRTCRVSGQASGRSWISNSGGCCRSRRCSSRWAGSPRASTSSTCCASRARCRCRTFAASISCSTSSRTRRSSRSSKSSRSTRRPSTCTSRWAICFGARARSIARSACTRTCSTAPTCRRTSGRPRSFELAQDFHRAGLLDRAEELFTKLDGTPFEHAVAGLPAADLRDRKRTGTKAIAATRRMEALAKRPYFKEIAHYHCELAQDALLRSQFDDARRVHRPGARRVQALHARHDTAGRCGGPGGKLCRRDRRLAAHRVAESRVSGAGRGPPRRCVPQHRRSGAGHSGAAQLRGPVSVAGSADALFNQILAHEGAEAATQLIKDELARNPTLLGLDKLLEAQLTAAPAERRHDLELVKNLVAQHIKRLGMYRCEQCGFRAKQYYWRCPGCSKWETYSPRRTETPDGFA